MGRRIRHLEAPASDSGERELDLDGRGLEILLFIECFVFDDSDSEA